MIFGFLLDSVTVSKQVPGLLGPYVLPCNQRWKVITMLASKAGLTIVSSEADGPVLQPLQVEQRLVGPHLLPGLHPATWLQGEVLVLHGPDVPPPCHRVKF